MSAGKIVAGDRGRILGSQPSTNGTQPPPNSTDKVPAPAWPPRPVGPIWTLSLKLAVGGLAVAWIGLIGGSRIIQALALFGLAVSIVMLSIERDR